MIRQREILEHDLDAIPIGLADLCERRIDARAERALVVGELDDGDRRRRIAAHRIVRGDRHGIARRIEHHLHIRAVLRLQLVDEHGARLLPAALLETA